MTYNIRGIFNNFIIANHGNIFDAHHILSVALINNYTKYANILLFSDSEKLKYEY